MNLAAMCTNKKYLIWINQETIKWTVIVSFFAECLKVVLEQRWILKDLDLNGLFAEQNEHEMLILFNRVDLANGSLIEVTTRCFITNYNKRRLFQSSATNEMIPNEYF